MLGSMLLFFACKNDMREVNQITYETELPELKINELNTVITDSGTIKIVMDAPVMQSFKAENKEQSNYDEYPEGLTVKFYNNDTLESKITAEYGIYYSKQQLWEAKRNVVAKNYVKHEQLNTEHLFWNMKKEKIYTHKFVRITTKEEVFIGTGFESNQDFSNWTINNPKGSFVINEEEEQQ
ncbi:MAG: LPS export ABC transporter periplasmic protein LptC [Bacteroidota bacterium]